jgi:hypothetical protein
MFFLQERLDMHIRGRLSVRTMAIAVVLFVLPPSLGLSVGLQPARQSGPAIPAEVRRALDDISADSLRGNLSFIASDLLEGRDTPSRGLELAAEYIAAQFRRAGIEPAGDEGYFQTANFVRPQDDLTGFALSVTSRRGRVVVPAASASWTMTEPFEIHRSRLFKMDYKNGASVSKLKPEQIEGKVVVTEIPDFQRADKSKREQMYREQVQFMSKMGELKPALLLSIDREATVAHRPGRVLDPESPRRSLSGNSRPRITVIDKKLIGAYDSWPVGPTGATISLRIPPPVEIPVKLHNVIGLLRGSDPELKDTYVLITAHYDHIGMKQEGEGDRIYNGANDDGSGTVSVIELASALATLSPRPRRSIVFMTFFGEERGGLGSRYYGRHPVFPVAKTIADVNLEQIGRTDSTEGPQVSNATLTGFDYSDMGPIFKAAGEALGVRIYKHPVNSDLYFSRSDNQSLADLGVPAHTLCVAFDYPDYHGVGDHWDKIDYANMEKIDRMVGLSIAMIANDSKEPSWNPANPKAAGYLKAWKTAHGK